MSTRAIVVALGVALVVSVVGGWMTSATAQQLAIPGPSMSAPAAARPGDIIIVTLTNWPTGVATVSTCSNAAARGTQDCALAADDSIAVRDSHAVSIDLEVAVPPGPCPCVIRGTTPTGNITVTAPIVIVGQAIGPIIQPTGASNSSGLQVRSSVVTAYRHFPESVAPALGGSVDKVLVVDLANGDQKVGKLHVVAEVGKKSEKEPIAARDVRGLEPGEHRRLRIPFVISAPAWGTYTVTGSVYGAGSPLPFRTTTSNDPWLLLLLVPVLLIAIAEVLRARDRRERRREEAAEAAVVPLVVAATATAAESSPEVGIPYGERYGASSYAPSRNGGGTNGNGEHSDHDAGVALTI